MPENKLYPPEGLRPPAAIGLPALQEALESGAVLEAPVQRCGVDHALHLDLGGVQGRIPREEAVAPWISGAERDIAVLSRVGKPTCFTVTALEADGKGAPVALLSRRAAQEEAMAYFLDHLEPGSLLTGRITRLESFGAFVDIGRGIVAMLPIEHISVSRIAHPRDRFQTGQKILAAVWSIDRAARRIALTHRELLGTWEENAALFKPGMTVPGYARGIKDYGAFVELTPNLSGLAESKEGIREGDRVSVYIKSILPQRMKLKLLIIDQLPPAPGPEEPRYFLPQGKLKRWSYAPEGCRKAGGETVFGA